MDIRYLAIGIGVILGGCESKYQINRPVEPWVLRSTLNYRPRMVTVALDSECYVAYDLNQCGLYRAWKGGVHWEGIVYTDTKSMQPTVWGTDYLRDELMTSPWSVQKLGRMIQPDVQFKGYSFEGLHIVLNYRLIADADTFWVKERPEFIRSRNDKPGLERQFVVTGTSTDPVPWLRVQGKTVPLRVNERTNLSSFFELLPDQAPKEKPPRSDDAAQYWMEQSGCFTCHEWTEATVGPGFLQIARRYKAEPAVIAHLSMKVKQGGSGVWGSAVMNPHPDLAERDIADMVRFILDLDTTYRSEPGPSQAFSMQNDSIRPGFGAPLAGVHPSFDVTTIRKAGLDLRVGGMAFLPDGRLVVATWTPQGRVYVLDEVQSGDSSQVGASLIASGLAEPLGLEVVGNDIFVLQKQELTQLVDLDGDGKTDEYRTICNGFDASSDFHEFAFGLVHKEGFFYANLSLPMRLMEGQKPAPDRGRTIKISIDGSFQWVNSGLRQPNGIGKGPDGELFITDNQGQWLPANKLIHVRPGDFHGMRWVLPDSLSDLEMVPPTLWLPQDEIANSPSEPALMQAGLYRGQVIFGDVSHGGIKRAYLEKVKGAYQGAVFRFTQGLEAGVNRMRWGPDGALYIGGVGMVGGWSWKGTRQGLQRMTYNGNETFEMLTMKVLPNGFTIQYTQPLGEDQGNSPKDYQVRQWWYLPTERYGGPKMDLEQLAVEQVQVSADRSTVDLRIPGLKEGHVVYLRLADDLLSSTDQGLWSSEAWYTLNQLPSNDN